MDRDIDQARIEIAALSQEFLKAESLAHVKGRGDRRQAMALYFGDPSRPAPITPEFDIAIGQKAEVDRLVASLRAVLVETGSGRDVALAAIAELGSQLAEPGRASIPAFPDPLPVPLKRRRA